MPDTTQGGQSGDERARRDLIAWSVDESLVGAHNLSRWYKGSTHRRLPDKAQLSVLGLESVGDGWSPAEPLIFPSTRVVAIGSCFARYFILWLAEHGFNKSMPHSPYNALLKFGSRLESPACVAQQFRWAFGELDDKSVFWIDENKEVFEASEERRLLVRDTLLATDVLILTLGLSEIWYDRITGEPLWRALPVDQFDPGRHVFAVETMAQTLQWLETIERLRARHVPEMKIIFTVSPVRLATTFRPVSALTANSVSKAIVRAALDEFLRNHQQELGRQLFYFPSYELVADYFLDPYEPDNRHVSSTVAANIVSYFVGKYCSADVVARTGSSLTDLDVTGDLEQFVQQSRIVCTDARSGALLARIAALEEKMTILQTVCDERRQVIVGLDHAARERLELIHRLDAKIKRLTT
jgi:BMFP domain-containing protein YqiC